MEYVNFSNRCSKRMHTRRRQGQGRGNLITGTRRLDDQPHGKSRVLLLDSEQTLNHRWRQCTGLTAVGPRLGQQCIEAALAVALQPIAKRLRSDRGTGRAWDGVLLGSLLFELPIESLGTGREGAQRRRSIRSGTGQSHGVGQQRCHSWCKLLESGSTGCDPGGYCDKGGGSGPVCCWMGLLGSLPEQAEGLNPSGGGR